MPETVAIIPARAGSQRIPGKNVRMLAGHPLLAYSIAAALQSGVCDRVLVSTDSLEIAKIALDYGAEVPELRPLEMSGPSAHDILSCAMRWTIGFLLPPTSCGLLPGQLHPCVRPSPFELRVQRCSKHPGRTP